MLKMENDHLEILKKAIKPLDTEERRIRYRNGEFERSQAVENVNLRYRWDLLWESGIKIGDGVGMPGLPLYKYLNDSHIDSALKTIIPDLHLPAPEPATKDNIKCVVRIEDGKPIIFMVPEDPGRGVDMIDTFKFEDGHNTATIEYMRSLPLADQAITESTIKAYQNHIDSLPVERVEIVPVRRLRMR